ncbi:MAG: DUF3857 domain-containing protein [Bacteroidia bacterium]|nr:DUF3857 domain-containing protein [Bacteroidia bacterium]
MKQNKILIALIFSLSLYSGVWAQKFVYQSYKWDASPKLHSITDEEKKENYLNLKYRRTYEFAYETSGDLVMYVSVHCIIKVNNEKGVEAKNKVYISTGGVIEEMDLKARVIDKNGKVIPLDKSGIKKIDNYENAGPFTIFALEGVEPGCEIEYIYTNKESSDYWKTLYTQFEFSCLDQDVEVISPANLVFEAKGYNAWPEFKKDTTLAEKNRIWSHLDKVPMLHEERYSFYNESRMRVDFKLAFNTAKDRARLFTWETAGVTFYGRLFSFSKKELSEAGSFVKKLKVDGKTEEEKIKKLENFIKENFASKEGGTEEYFLVDKIISNKYGSSQGIMRLFLASLKKMEIPFEVVLTSNRTDRKFDKEFDTWSFLQEYLIYIPSLGSYLSPSEFSSRLGFPPSELTGNKGLFIKEVNIGDVYSGIAKVKEIASADYSVSTHSTFVDVKFDAANISEPAVKLKETFTGYSAYFYQPIYRLLDNEKKLEVNESLLKLTGEDTKVTNVKASNFEEESMFIKPFILECDITSPTIVEKAGDKYLFKLGLLIGAQAELYQEGQRQTAAEINYGHGFYRELSFNIPDGYKLSNPDDIKLETLCNINGELKARFRSEYELNGNTVKVKVYEDYRALLYPLNVFEDFRKVINAAADFNKVTLIFEKK